MDEPTLFKDMSAPLERIEVFKAVDTFRAGTFKFEINTHYQPDD